MKKTTKKVTKKVIKQDVDTSKFKTAAMTFKTMLLSKISFNPKNPVIRTDQTHMGFKSLLANIRKNGLLTPIIVASNGTVIDGNRRLTALKHLGVKEAPVVMHNSTSHKVFDELFVSCNEDTMLINACQELERYLNGAKVKTTTLHAIEKVKEVGGVRVLRQIVNVGKSPITFCIALGMIRTYTGITDKIFLRKALKWMLTVGSAYRLKASIADYIPVPRLVNAIETGTPLVAKWHKSYKPITKGENLTTVPEGKTRVITNQLNGKSEEIVGYTTV
jgi:hypothetical protein